MSRKYTCIDLFSGAGGLSKGFLDADFNVLIGVDFDDAALRTFEKNHGTAKAMKLNLFDHDNINYLVEEFEKFNEELDVLVGGPPCQGFSLAGKREEHDERNTLYEAMVKTAKILKPKVVVLENVPGMLNLYGGKAKEKIFKDFEDLGYNMDVDILYAPQFGIPQIRKRAFFVGLLNSDTKFSYPLPILNKSEYICCKDAIEDLPSLEGDNDYRLDTVRSYTTHAITDYQKKMRLNSKMVYNHIPTKHSQKTIDHIMMVPDGGKYTDLPDELAKKFKYHESLHRYNSSKPSLTIDTGHRTHFHYKYNRIPTVRENARLQSFPDDFIFFGNKQEQYKQVGNAVPPLLGYAIAKKVKEYLDSIQKINIIDLFAGCGGLLDGFLQTGKFNSIASVEWEKGPVDTLRHRLRKKWKYEDVDKSVIRFDMQRIDELCGGFDTIDYGKSEGLNNIIKDRKIDVIIGGPPCQAYSVAGRVSDKNGMNNDYRNYLFEYYLELVDTYQPKAFVFENVPGMLSAMPDGTLITDLIKRDIESKGYEIINDIKKYAVLDSSDFGVPQQRKRVILLGIRKENFKKYNLQEILADFYNNIITKHITLKKKTVFNAIGDLPKCYPLDDVLMINGRRYSHNIPECHITAHVPRYHNSRDIKIFKMLSYDIESGENKYVDSDILKDIYNNATGSKTNVHKYHVLRKDRPSTTILAHLYKDGLRFIHYDHRQARSITVREAARLQTFDDDFEFISSMSDAYKMIGNAVPPLLAKKVALSLFEFLNKYKGDE